MKWIKTIFLIVGGLFVFALLMVSVVVLTFDDDDYRRLAIHAVEAFTGTTVAIDGSFEFKLSAEPSLSAESIQIISTPIDSSLSIGRIGKIHIQIALRPLLNRIIVVKKVLIKDVALVMAVGPKKSSQENFRALHQNRLDPTIPVLENVSIQNFRIDITHTGTMRSIDIALNQFTIESLNENEALRIKGEGAISGKPFQIEGQLGALAQIFSATSLFPVVLTYHSNEFFASATGTIQNVVRGKGLAIELSGGSDELSDLLGLTNVEAPPLGNLLFRAQVGGDLVALSISDLSLTLSGEPQIEVVVDGKIDNAFTGAGADIQFVGSCTNRAIFSKLLPENWPQVHRLHIKGALRDSSGMLTLEGLNIETAADQMSLSLAGRIPIPNGRLPESVVLDMSAAVENTATLHRFLDASIPTFGPVSGSGQLTTHKQDMVYSGEIRVGKTLLESQVRAVFSDKRPKIQATVSSGKINLEDFGLDGSPVVPPNGAEDLQPQERWSLFSDHVMPIDALKAMDLDLTLDVEALMLKEYTTGEVNVHLQLENGRLRIHPAKISYAEGVTEFELTIDADSSPPAAVLKVDSEDIDIGEVLAIAQQPMVLSGDLNWDIDLKSKGRSTREMVSNLNGEIHFALEDGEIRRIVNYLSTDAMNLILNTADPRQSTSLNCMAGSFRFNNGIGNIDWFAMDTPRIRATAAGKVNLGTETIDIGINPEEKQRMLLREGSAVQIYGTLANPSVRVLPISEAARLYGKLLMPHVFLSNRALGSLWYLVSRDGDTSPCLKAVRDP